MTEEEKRSWDAAFTGRPPQFIVVKGRRTLGWERKDGSWWCPGISRIVSATELEAKPKLTLEQRVKRLEDMMEELLE